MGTAVVTGAASGIGRALARRLAAGHQVHLVDVAATADLAAELGGVGHTADVASAEDLARVADAAPAPDVLCLNAGIVGGSLGVPWEVPDAEWHRLLDVNVLGVVHGLRAFVPGMVGRGRGRILITGSLAGLVTFPGGGAYAATKHAVVSLAESAALALRGTPVTVTLACPALVRTAMSEVGADPDEVAAEALAAADSGRFLVVPSEWGSAVVGRATQLVSGVAPATPAPSGARPPAHYLFSSVPARGTSGPAARELATASLRAGRWGVGAGEPHREDLAPGDLVLLYLGAPDRVFLGRAEVASAVHDWTPSEAQAFPGDAAGGVRLTDVEEWDPPVRMGAVLQAIDPAENARADFEAGVVRITATEYDAALAVAGR